MRPLVLAVPLLSLAILPGCQSLMTEATSSAAGIAGASIASGLGANATLTTGIGLGLQALGRAGLQYAQRRVHRAAQNRIATAAGPLPVGSVARWATDHEVPVEPNERGEVTVSRVISAGALTCKEIIFSVHGGSEAAPQRAFYIAAICRDGNTWRWASAEPATERWGSLQ